MFGTLGGWRYLVSVVVGLASGAVAWWILMLDS